MVWVRDEKVRLGVHLSGGRAETHREETKRTSKEALDRWKKQDLEKFGIPNWKEKVLSREEWKVSVAAKTLEELRCQGRRRFYTYN